ncbi:MAG: EAL domain-containing protein [Sulfitobacter sp. SK025]|nr:MAG: EAL domain-containing protein [Sulfitobacter sp. SK025]
MHQLEQLGCRIDLDDFGTGQASIGAIHQFGVTRIKIDRSFVARADRCSKQKQVINAILAMAEHFGVETLAEGVETVGEHTTLAQLGCDHVQGFGIASAMPFEQTLQWIPQNTAKIQHVPKLVGGIR